MLPHFAGMIIKLRHCELSAYLGCDNDQTTSYELENVQLIPDQTDENYDMRALWRVDCLSSGCQPTRTLSPGSGNTYLSPKAHLAVCSSTSASY